MKAAKSLEITVLVDNYIDILLPASETVERAPILEGDILAKNPIAEHGLSLLFEVDGRRFIMDFGLSSFGLCYNMDAFGADPKNIEFGVLSHGHHDHRGCLLGFMEKRKKPFDLYMHKDATLKERFLRFPDGRKAHFPPFELESLKYLGLNPITIEKPTEALDGLVVISGEIPRVTEFERGFPGAFCIRDGKEEPDPIKDDMSVYFVLEGKGLVVVSGCAHSGIINSILYGMEVTGEKNLYAVLGGFHLTGHGMEEVVPKTVQEMKKLNPKVLVPMHCTGWFSQVELLKAFPEAFILSAPGTRIKL